MSYITTEERDQRRHAKRVIMFLVTAASLIALACRVTEFVGMKLSWFEAAAMGQLCAVISARLQP